MKPSICCQPGKYATINAKHFIFQHPYQHFNELRLCLIFLWIISKERNLNAFIPTTQQRGFFPEDMYREKTFCTFSEKEVLLWDRRRTLWQRKYRLSTGTTNLRFSPCSSGTGKGCLVDRAITECIREGDPEGVSGEEPGGGEETTVNKG